MSVFEKYGLRRVINASGKMTVLGASAVHDEVAAAIKAAAMDYVEIEELLAQAGKVIAKATGAEDGCPTAGASAGIAISTAAVIAGKNLDLVERLPDSTSLKNKIILQKGHAVNFGAKVTQMIRLGGGIPIEVGSSNLTAEANIENAIDGSTAALFYVKSHHAVQKGMVTLDNMIDIAHRHQLPIIVDAAAEEDLRVYIKKGADLVLYSGGKALEGPTSGFICGSKTLSEACRLQYKGIGRPMKTGKESIIGLLTAIERYASLTPDGSAQKEKMQRLLASLADTPGIRGSIEQDEAGREIYRARLAIDSKTTKISAADIVRELESGNPAIYTRNYQLAQGIIHVDPRPLLADQENIISQRIRAIIQQAKENA